MKYFSGIVESAFPPPTNYVWVSNGDLKYFSNGKWAAVGNSQNLVETVEQLGNAIGLIEKNVTDLQKTKLSSVPAATTTTIGGITKGAAVANLAAGADIAAVVTGFNALLASLRAAGIITT